MIKSRPAKQGALGVLFAAFCSLSATVSAQNLVTDDTVEWYTLGGDYAHTRYTPADEITADNFDELEVAWE